MTDLSVCTTNHTNTSTISQDMDDTVSSTKIASGENANAAHGHEHAPAMGNMNIAANGNDVNVNSDNKSLRHLNKDPDTIEKSNVNVSSETSSSSDEGGNMHQKDGERIQFTIGKKRRKPSGSSTDGSGSASESVRKTNKRSTHVSNLNVFESDEGQSQSLTNDKSISNNLSSSDSAGSCENLNLSGKEYADKSARGKEEKESSAIASASDVFTSNSDGIGDSSDEPLKCKQQQQQLDESQHPHFTNSQPGSESGNDAEYSTSANKSEDTSKNPESLSPKSNDNATISQTSSIPIQSQSQQEAWRVKLYRLNADGSWDDCGTGRILCVISDGNEKNDKGEAASDHDSNDDNTGNGDGNGSGNTNNIKKTNNVEGTNNNDANATDNDNGSANTSDAQNDLGTGGKEWANLEQEIYVSLGEPTLCMHAEVPANAQLQNLQLAALTNKAPKVLLRTRVLLRESYQRQGDNIITWCEPFFLPATTDGQNEGQNHQPQKSNNRDDDDLNCGVDLALSFQENAGCREIWNKISKIQHTAYELFEAKGGLLIDGEDSELEDMTRTLTDQHGISGAVEDEDHKDMDGNPIAYVENRDGNVHQHAHNDNHRDLWGESTGIGHSDSGIDDIDVDEHGLHGLMESSAVAVSMAAQAAHYVGNGDMNGKNQVVYQGDSIESNYASANFQLCNPPTLENLEKIADAIAASQLQQREAIAMTISQLECAYLKKLLTLFPSAEAKNNYHALATLASIVKSIFLFNDPTIIQLVASDEKIFEDCCCCLEYDPDLKEKADHRWFIQNRLKFRTVLFMEDEELIDSIHKAFRVTYIRDTLLRPTMDESSLSTLGSLLTFTHADVVKGVMCSPRNKNAKSHESYLVRILRLLGKEIRAIRQHEWEATDQNGRSERASDKNHKSSASVTTIDSVQNNYQQPSTPWNQYLIPQDNSLSSRKLRRRGCLSFLKEMFNMVRMSLQQSDKDDFYAMIVLMDVKLNGNTKQSDNNTDLSRGEDNDTVNLLSLLGAIMSDSNADVSERGACLDILSAIAMHEPSLIRRHCLEFSSSEVVNISPEPDDKREVVFACPPTDLCLSLLYVMATENDAGIILQTCEVLRIVLDTEVSNETSQFEIGAINDNEDGMIRSDNSSFNVGSIVSHGHSGGECEQNKFLQKFYDHYIAWLVAPFQYSISIPKTAIPFILQAEKLENETLLRFLKRRHQRLKDTKISRSGLFKTVAASSIRLSFSVELLSFCVRSHCYKMKRYLINSRVLINVMKLLSPSSKAIVPTGDRCLKLGALRCLRSIISLKDEFYNRHIVQHSLFTPVFEAFRANPVGDNLVSSSIIEICEFIRIENIKSLIEDIVRKHMRQQSRQISTEADTSIVKLSPSLEDVATPYVDTLTLLRKKYEENVILSNNDGGNGSTDNKNKRIAMSEKAIEDQRKFRENDKEESYFFDSDDSNNADMNYNSDNRQNGILRQGYGDMH